MNRRNFVAGIVGLFASIKAAASIRAVPLGEEGYTYNWRNGGTTDDPRLNGVLPFGGRDVHGLWLDGKDAMDLQAFKVKTGPNGYIEYSVMDSEGNYQFEEYDSWNDKWVPQEEIWAAHKYNEICPERGKRWTDARTVNSVKRGTVRYIPVGGFSFPEKTGGV